MLPPQCAALMGGEIGPPLGEWPGLPGIRAGGMVAGPKANHFKGLLGTLGMPQQRGGERTGFVTVIPLLTYRVGSHVPTPLVSSLAFPPMFLNRSLQVSQLG